MSLLGAPTRHAASARPRADGSAAVGGNPGAAGRPGDAGGRDHCRRRAALARGHIAIEQIDNGARVQVEADGDYFVLTTTAGASACTVTLPEGSKVGLTPPARAKRSIRSAGAQYAMQGFFTPDRSGKARIRCLGAGEQIGVAQWPGDYERAVNLGRWTGYAAIACLVGGIAMIVFRGRKPRYY
ncbi:MAG: hypothetical protein R2734_08750 [Nocardioides sp.]